MKPDRGWRILLGYLLANLVAIPLLRFISLPDVPPVQQLLGYLLFCLCIFPIVWHFSHEHPGLPVFPIICLAYAASFALPVYYGAPMIASETRTGILPILAGDTTRALWFCLLGVFSMQCGFWIFRISVLPLVIPRVRLELDPRRGPPMMIVMGLAGLALLWFGVNGVIPIPPRLLAIFGLAGRLATLSIGYLYAQFIRGRLNPSGKASLVLLLFLTIGLGLSMGNTRNALDPLIAIGAIHWMVKRSVSWKVAALGAVLFMGVQSLKGEFRNLVWIQGQGQSSIFARLEIWRTLIGMGISQKLGRQPETGLAIPMAQSLARADMIHLFGHAVSQTPQFIPYQHGQTYSYLLYMLIPRAVWPGKPSAQAANEFFGLTYHLQSPGSIGKTSIGLPHIVEAYINFGPLGIACIMMVLGMVYASLDRLFNHAEAGGGGVALYATILFGLLNIETATAASFGALLQTIVIYACILRLAKAKKRTA